MRATDESSIESISGAPAAAVEGAGIGIAMAVNQIGNTTRARVSGGSLDVGNLLVQGRSQALIRSVAASVGLAAIGAGVAGSTAVNLINNDTLAGIEGGAAVLARGNAGVIAWGDNQVLSAAGVIAGTAKGPASDCRPRSMRSGAGPRPPSRAAIPSFPRWRVTATAPCGSLTGSFHPSLISKGPCK